MRTILRFDDLIAWFVVGMCHMDLGEGMLSTPVRIWHRWPNPLQFASLLSQRLTTSQGSRIEVDDMARLFAHSLDR